MIKVIVIGVVAIVIVLVIAYMVDGAVNCSHQGGEYVRNWAGWPVCIGGSK